MLLETHSEHLLLRFFRRIKEGAATKDDVSIMFLNRPDGMVEVTADRLVAMEDGSGLEGTWPANFFGERLREFWP